jgi:hypothetical protein
MARFLGVVAAAVLLAALWSPASAGDKDARAILDKGIKALGGEAKLGKVKALTWKAKGTVNVGGEDAPFTSRLTAEGLDRCRAEFEGEFGGNKVKGVAVIAGSKGWRKFGDMGGAMNKSTLADEKRTAYLRLVPVLLVPLKGKGFKFKAAGEKKVGGKPAVGLHVTAPDGKDFKLYFDKESGLPVQLAARVRGFTGEMHDQETTFGGYKDFGGIKKATKIQSKRDGEKFVEEEITEFKVLAKVDPKTFAEPK